MDHLIRIFWALLLATNLCFASEAIAQNTPAPEQPEAAVPPTQIPTETQRENALQVTYRILTHPTSQKIFRVLSDPEVKKLLDDSVRRFNFQKFLLAQLIALIVILILRSAFYPRRGFVKWILTDLWIGLVFFLIQIFIIPYALLGKTFFDLVNRMVQAW